MGEFLRSKKTKGLIVGILSVVLVNVLPAEQVNDAINAIMVLVSSYLVAQGAADLGKGKAIEEKKANGK